MASAICFCYPHRRVCTVPYVLTLLTRRDVDGYNYCLVGATWIARLDAQPGQEDTVEFGELHSR